MTSKEIVRRTIEFDNPPRIPVAIGNMELPNNPDLSNAPLLIAWQEKCLDDIVTVPYAAADGGPISKEVEGQKLTKLDEWGVKWVAGHAEKPPIDTWDKWNTYPFPDPHAPARFAKVKEIIKAKKDRYLMGLIWNSTFERMWTLRGFENLLIDPYINRKLFLELRDKYLEFNLAILDKWIQTEVDAIYFGDDLGTQKHLVMSPEMWRKYYLPMYRELFGRAHAAGKAVLFHRGGDIMEILADLVHCGMDVINPVQANAMDVRVVLKEFGKDIVIWGATDLQDLIVHGTPETIEREIEKVTSLCWRGGGYIGGTAQGCPPGTPIANIEAFYRAFIRLSGVAM